MTADRYAFTGSGTAWSVTLGGVTVLTASSQARPTGEFVARLVDALNDALDDAEAAERTAATLGAFVDAVEGRAPEVVA